MPDGLGFIWRLAWDDLSYFAFSSSECRIVETLLEYAKEVDVL